MKKTNTYQRRSRSRGFSLVELMVVVAIVGVLTSVAVPRFLKHRAFARQAAAKATLKHVASLQEAYFSQNGRYAHNFTDLGFDPNSSADGYEFQFETPGGPLAPTQYAVKVFATTNYVPGCAVQDTWFVRNLDAANYWQEPYTIGLWNIKIMC